jgi:hypothetical protein
MTLPDGSELGPYRIVTRLGVGGMGEVYRAHDDRLDRDVAIKILPADVADDPERLERFDREARASAALNHPNIVAVHDIGRTDAVTYVVMELLDGSTLHDELASRPPTPRKAVEWTIGVAEGLAAAHARGIVHRDIKPDNLIVTADGRIKILDFGIARFTAPEANTPDAETIVAGTEPGKVLGTAGYMSPEQVRGEAIDSRSDIFSLGAVLYEMLAGQRAFERDTAVETMNAVLTTDLPDLTGTGQAISPSLDRIVRRCIEKRAEDRFHSAHDLALALEAVSGSGTQPELAIPAAAGAVRMSRMRLAAGAVVLIAATAALSTWWAGVDPADTSLPEISQVTVRRGTIDAARFSSGGDSVVYSGRYGGALPAPFETHLSSPEARQIGPDGAMLFAASEGALALGLRPQLFSSLNVGTLATLPAGASAARELAELIASADFVVGGVAAVEVTGNGSQLHFPLGTVVEESTDLLLFLRASPEGTAVAFHPLGGGIVVFDADGARTVADTRRVTGLAWAPSGDRVWFSSRTGNGESTIWSFEPGAAPRQEWRAAGNVTIEDIAADGRVLVKRDQVHAGTLLISPQSEEPVDLSWLDQSTAIAMSPEANSLLLSAPGGFYLRDLDGSPAVRLGGGGPKALSADGELVISGDFRGESFTVTPVGVGTPRELAHPGVEGHFAWFHPDGRRLLFNGREAGGTWRYFAMNLDGSGDVERVGPDNLEHWVGQEPLTNDGEWILGYPLPSRVVALYSLDSDETIPVQGLAPDDRVIRFTENDREVYVFNRDGLPVRIWRLDYRTGSRSLWREFMPADPGGIAGIPTVVMSADGRYIGFNYARTLSSLFVITGLE